MPRTLRLIVSFALFGLFCLCAAYLVSGIQRFEQNAEVAMFSK